MTSRGEPAPFERFIQRFGILIIIVSGCLVYANSLHNDFVWDDTTLILGDKKLSDWGSLKEELTHPLGYCSGRSFDSYRPLQTLSYMADRWLWGTDPAGFRCTSIFFHVAAAVLLFFLLTLIIKNPAVAFLTAELFVVHPVHTSGVVYLAARDNPLGLFFFLLAFLGYCNWTRRKGYHAAPWFIISLAGAWCAFMSREIMFLIPVMFIWYEVVFRQDAPGDLRRLFIRIAPYAALLALYYFFFYRVAKPILLTEMNHYQDAYLTTRNALLILSPVLATYLRLLAFPYGLHMTYIFPLPRSFTEEWIFSSFLALIVIAGAAGWLSRRSKELRFAAGWFIIWFLPVSNLWGFFNAVMAEHWIYTASIGYFLFISILVVRYAKRPTFAGRAVLGSVICVLAAYGIITAQTNTTWKNEESIYLNTLKYSPYDARTIINLARIYKKQGKRAEAEQLLTKAHQLRPDLY
ncbi:MAG: tetratricopeptide repeat protein [Candidatus Omnitrophica bacterium]|nr:tetratricopeptide repeat protein [Candidatus Omnitrophota bacterium]